MKESCNLKEVFPVSPKELYEAWLDGDKHAEMTGGPAEGTAEVGTEFSAWGGYIWGENKALEPHTKIVQTWRTSEFHENDEDSLLEVHFKEVENGTEMTIKHTNIPEGQTQYQKGWDDHYIIPMREHFKK